MPIPPLPFDPASLVEAARAGDERALARLVSVAEGGGEPAARLARLVPFQPPASWQVIGLPGSPGAGKSSLAAALIGVYRAEGRRVAVLAVDPSSPYSGGALLGDRVRMQAHGLDDSVFIRSIASRGHLGGLSPALPDVLALVAACGYSTALVETLGAGQAEVEIARHADITAVVLAPGFGDAVQLSKAGILEIADVLVVNKADLEGAEALRRALEQALDTAAGAGDTAAGAGGPSRRLVRPTRPPVLRTCARTGEGVPGLVDALEHQLAALAASGELARRRRAAVVARIEAVWRELVSARFEDPTARARLDDLAAGVLAGDLDPYSAARQMSGS